MTRAAWRATGHGVANSLGRTEHTQNSISFDIIVNFSVSNAMLAHHFLKLSTISLI